MRTKGRATLAILCLLFLLMILATYWLARETEAMELECVQLQDKLRELRAENEVLACRLAELRELLAIREETGVCRE